MKKQCILKFHSLILRDSLGRISILKQSCIYQMKHQDQIKFRNAHTTRLWEFLVMEYDEKKLEALADFLIESNYSIFYLFTKLPLVLFYAYKLAMKNC